MIFLGAILALVAFVTVTRRDVSYDAKSAVAEAEAEAHHHHRH